MKKLKLTVDELHVESFRTDDEEAFPRGTVHGNASDSTCMQRICECSGDTDWDVSCGTCNAVEYTCYNTCPSHFNCPTAAGYQGC
ncbi:MAG TPA: hypothetical protein VGC13_30490 [Longimicrobium sp.]|jgi:hypothetical protein|uniref:hypothetical protein n=1 Tax=Longimicrobium sp. TaxID=2029185 RepID=UPI002EDA12E6